MAWPAAHALMALSIRQMASPTHRSLWGPLGRLRPVFHSPPGSWLPVNQATPRAMSGSLGRKPIWARESSADSRSVHQKVAIHP